MVYFKFQVDSFLYMPQRESSFKRDHVESIMLQIDVDMSVVLKNGSWVVRGY